jgi:hypothetical protein
MFRVPLQRKLRDRKRQTNFLNPMHRHLRDTRGHSAASLLTMTSPKLLLTSYVT